jgi:hypothetical protein
MVKEEKTIVQAVLTVIIFAVSSYFTLGQSIFPFPLNEILFAIVAAYFTALHFKKSPLTMLFILLSSLFGVLSSQFYWEILLNNQQMTFITQQEYPFFFRKAYESFLMVWMLFLFRDEHSKKIKALLLFPLSFQLLDILFEFPLFGSSSLALLFIYALLRAKRSPLLYLWILLFFLEATKLWHLVPIH